MSKQTNIELIRQDNMISEILVNRDWIIETLKTTNENIEITEYYDVMHNRFPYPTKDAMYDDDTVKCELDIDRLRFEEIIESTTVVSDIGFRMIITNGNKKQKVAVLIEMDFHTNLYNCIKLLCDDSRYLISVVDALESTRDNYAYKGYSIKRVTEVRDGLLPSEAANKNVSKNTNSKVLGFILFVFVVFILLYLGMII